MPKKLFFPISIILIGTFNYTMAQNATEIIINDLTSAGYENVRVLHSDSVIYASIENNIYRWNVKGISEALAIITGHTTGNIKLILLKNGIPQIEIGITGAYWCMLQNDSVEFSENLKITYHTKESWVKLKKLPLANSNENKFDIILFPQIRVQFGNYKYIVDDQINITPTLNVSFWKGMNLTTQVIFPLHNNLDLEGDYIRPGFLTINQTVRLPFNTFTSFAAGYFNKNRYGIDLETRNYFINDKISIGTRCGYTGSASILSGRWTYSELNTFTWYADIAYRYAIHNLTVKVGYGSFIAKDKGWRFDIYRQFGEVPIGFFAMRSGGVVNGGFNFQIPLPPCKYWKKRAIRLRPASYFTWEYRAKGLPTEGKIYTTGSSLENYLNTINPDYLKYYLIKK